MSAANRVERPTLQGQRIKTRKRDEKEKYDPGGFRDSIIAGINDLVSGSKSSSPDTDNSSPTVESATGDQNGVSVGPLVTKARLEALSKWLDERGSKKDDYRKYGEVLFDVLVAGGILGQWHASRCLLLTACLSLCRSLACTSAGRQHYRGSRVG